MKKRFLAMLLAGAMVMGLVGCGSSESSKETTNEKTGAEKFKIWSFHYGINGVSMVPGSCRWM